MSDLQTPQPISGTGTHLRIAAKVTTGTLFRRTNNQLVADPKTAKSAKLQANPFDEYVASAPYYLAATYLRSLSFAIDDITADFGADLYDRMMLDGQVCSDVNTIKMAILAQGIQMQPAIKRFQTDAVSGKRTENPRWKLAQTICDFCKRNFDGTQVPFDEGAATPLYWSLYNLLDSLCYGNKVGEKVYDLQPSGPDARKVVLKALKIKPRKSIAFVVDPYLNLLGMLALVPGQAMPVLTQALVGDPAQIPNFLLRRKFCVMSFRPKDSDPRGSSILRAAYDAWFVKQQIKIERLAFIARFTGGNVVGFTAPESQDQDIVGDDGAPVLDANGLATRIAPEIAMLSSLVNFRSGSVSVFPSGAKVEVHYPPAETPFEAALDRQDREISQAIMGQTRATHEAEHGSKADSGTAQDILGLVITQGKMALAATIRDDILRDLVEFNWPGCLDLIPLVSCSNTEQQDFADNATAVAALQSAQYFAPSQLPDVDARLGLPIRTEAEMQPQTQPGTEPGNTEPASGGRGKPGAKPASTSGPAQKFVALMRKLMGAKDAPTPDANANTDDAL